MMVVGGGVGSECRARCLGSEFHNVGLMMVYK